MFCALRDCILAMERTKHNSSPQVLKDSFDREICGYLSEQVKVIVNYKLFQEFPTFFFRGGGDRQPRTACHLLIYSGQCMNVLKR